MSVLLPDKPAPAHGAAHGTDAVPTRLKPKPRYVEFAGTVFAGWTARISGGALAILALCAIFADVLAPFDPRAQDLLMINLAPSWMGGAEGHLLGTDGLGRDIASRLLFGLRLSLVIGLSAATIAACLGLLLGVLAGYYEKILGAFLLRLADVQLSLPFAAVGIALSAVVGSGAMMLIVFLGYWGWTTFSRVIVSTVSQVRRVDYVVAARTYGASAPRIMIRHVLPAVVSPVVVLWTNMAGILTLAESGLSLLGLGVQPPEFTLGSMLADGQNDLRLAPWAAIAPGAVLMVILLTFNTFGDSLRDALTPGGPLAKHDPELS